MTTKENKSNFTLIGDHIFESGQAYWNYKKEHPEYTNKFWEENTSPKLHWWEIWK